jgi:hypothetical protein
MVPVFSAEVGMVGESTAKRKVSRGNPAFAWAKGAFGFNVNLQNLNVSP